MTRRALMVVPLRQAHEHPLGGERTAVHLWMHRRNRVGVARAAHPGSPIGIRRLRSRTWFVPGPGYQEPMRVVSRRRLC